MSTTAIAPSYGDSDDFLDFAAWQAEIDQSRVEPLTGPRAEHRPSRAVADKKAIAESLGEYRRRTNERRN